MITKRFLALLVACIALTLTSCNGQSQQYSLSVPVPERSGIFSQKLLNTFERMMTATGGKVCKAACKNGGICSEGQCFCPNGFVGDQCQIAVGTEFRFKSWLFVLICLGSMIMGLISVCLCWIVLGRKKDQVTLARRNVYNWSNES